jgi:protein-tyrosine phosphatase
MISHRHIRIAGSPNLRDLGGYQTQCGRRVKFDRLFRSGQLTGVKTDGWEFLQSVNLTRIYDFRRPDEIKRTPTNPPENFPVQHINIEITPGNHGGIAKRMNEKVERNSDTIEVEMQRLYMDYVRHCTADFSKFMHDLLSLEEDQSALFHCMAGKDRTGFAAAIILTCLNIDRETIESEYLLTKQYFTPEREIKRMEQRYADQLKVEEGDEEPDHSMFYPVFDTRLSYLRAAFEAIDEHWGSVDNYIANGLKLEADSIKRLKDMFLEDI